MAVSVIGVKADICYFSRRSTFSKLSTIPQRDRDLRRVAAGRELERPRNVIHNSGFLR